MFIYVYVCSFRVGIICSSYVYDIFFDESFL